jgi:hypothetical protein
MALIDDAHPHGRPGAEQFGRLVPELPPKIRPLSPHLSELEVPRAAACVAERRPGGEETLVWGVRPP